MGTLNYNSLKFDVPSGWQDASRIMLMGEVRDNVRQNIQIAVRPFDQADDFSACVGNRQDQIRKDLQGVELEIHSQPLLEDSSLKNAEIFYEIHDTQGKAAVCQSVVLLLMKPMLYEFSATYAPTQREAVRRDLMQIVSSIDTK